MGTVNQRAKNPEKEIYEGFSLYDTRHTGTISMKDLRHVLTRTGEKLTQSECMSLLLASTSSIFCYLYIYI